MRKTLLPLALLAGLALWAAAPATLADSDKSSGFFNGKDLEGWEGLTDYWSVKDGAIVGYTPKDPGFNTFLCSKKKYKDFELSFKIRLKDGKGNSGVQIRSKIINEKHFAVGGPQCDIGQGYWGSLYGRLQRLRDQVRGQARDDHDQRHDDGGRRLREDARRRDHRLAAARRLPDDGSNLQGHQVQGPERELRRRLSATTRRGHGGRASAVLLLEADGTASRQ
jgi:hypothetical protein